MRAYKNLEKPERCPVGLYKKYLSHVPDNLPETDNSFYLRSLSKANSKIWYYRKAAGKKTLGNVVRKIMAKVGFTGHYTNHSLRRSSATKLYDNNIPEKVVQETTGHRSVEGVRANKTTSSTMKRKMSDVLPGAQLPKECEISTVDIRKGNGLATLFNTIHDLRFSYFE